MAELRLAVADLKASIEFYGGPLGLERADRDGDVRFRTGSTDLVLDPRERAVDGRELDYRTVLIVFHAADVEATYRGLRERGLVFDNRRVAYSKIGGTTRFTDPSGHRFCLYQPSHESLTWGSGAKVIEVAELAAATS